ncbi:MAG: SOS response-associated peptidase family protein [Oligoflexales bacterium]
MRYLKLNHNIRENLDRFNVKIDHDSFVNFFSKRYEFPELKLPMMVEELLSADPKCSKLIDAFHEKQKASELDELAKNNKKFDELLEKLKKKPSKTTKITKERTERKISKLELKIKKHDSKKMYDYDYRVYPLFYTPIVVMGPDKNPILKPMRFQCLPRTKDEEYDKEHGLYKAKKESLTEKYFERIRKNSSTKSVWEPLFGHSHGIIILSGFYEYNKSGKNIGFGTSKSEFLLVPCLYDLWKSADGKKQLESFAVITDKASNLIKESGYHRCPVNIKACHFEAWLNPDGISNKDLHSILEDNMQEPFVELAS